MIREKNIFTSIITVHLSSNYTFMLFHLTLSECQTAYGKDSLVCAVLYV